MANSRDSGINMIINVLTKLVRMDTALGKMLCSFPEIVLGDTGVIKTIREKK